MTMVKYANGKPLTSVTVSVKSASIHRAIKEAAEKENLNIGFGDVVLSAIARSIRKHMNFNSNFDKKMRLYGSIDIGYFINVGRGTEIITIEDAASLDLAAISRAVKEKVVSYMRGEPLGRHKTPSILVTNLSPFSVDSAVPPLYAGQSCTIVIASERGAEKSFSITLSFDSRIADCQQAAEFLGDVKKNLE